MAKPTIKALQDIIAAQQAEIDAYKRELAKLSISIDITKHKQLEQELTLAKERAEAASQAKTNFLATVSHELRTPLNGIIGMADILLQNEQLTPRQYSCIQDIFSSGQYLLALVSDILDFSKLEAGKLALINAPFDLQQLTQSIVSDISHQLEQKPTIELRFIYDKHAPKYLIGDKLRLKQILINLLTNAIKFTEQGFIELAVECLAIKQQTATLQISVTDTGKGIVANKLETIFERFVQAEIDHAYIQGARGFGLGLAICKELVTIMGGSIHTKSILNQGSTFWLELTLPIADENEIPVNNEIPIPKPSTLIMNNNQSSSYSVLLIEDDAINSTVAALMLQQLGCKVEQATTGAQALNLLRQNTYAMIFCDIRLPDMRGNEIVQQFRQWETGQQQAPTPFVAVTGHAFEEEKRSFLAAGMDDVLTKPIIQEQLKQLLERWLDKTKI